ncbi:MAG: restriction endonuclease [Candidatus Bathyarchaeota archaeon]|nr:restriction endonuclease [Candidatus Bathyarchaeota archaeon]
MLTVKHVKGFSLDNLDSDEFQEFIVALFTKLGYVNIKVGSDTAVKSVDLTMEKATNIGGVIKYLVESKHQPRGTVGLSAVKIHHSTVVATPELDKGLIITSGRFSRQAIKFAETVGVELLDSQKLVALSIKTGLNTTKDYEQTYYTFPIAPVSQVKTDTLSFLRNNLTQFEGEITIDTIKLSLVPSFMISYSIDATFSTSVGVIHEINGDFTLFLSDDEKILPPKITENLDELNISPFTLPTEELNLEKNDFKNSIDDIETDAKEKVSIAQTEDVVYVGGNNHHYEKQCKPKHKDITILGIKQVYIPLWIVVSSIINKKYVLSVLDDDSELNVLPPDLLRLEKSSEVDPYPQSCMCCYGDFRLGKFVCAECGKITCSKDNYICDSCGRQVCSDHIFNVRKYFFLKAKYCPACKAERDRKK